MKKLLIFLTLISLAGLLSSCSRYYNIMSVEGEIISVDIKELTRDQRKLIKEYKDEEIGSFEVMESGLFTAEELVGYGLLRADEFSGEAILEGAAFTGMPYVDPDILIRIISGNATADDIQALYDAGMTEQEVSDLMPSLNNRTVEEDQYELPPSD